MSLGRKRERKRIETMEKEKRKILDKWDREAIAQYTAQ